MVDSVDLMKVNEIGTNGRLTGEFLNSYNRARGLSSVGCSGWEESTLVYGKMHEFL